MNDGTISDMIKIFQRIISYLYLYLDMIMKKDIKVVFFCMGSRSNIRKSIFSSKKFICMNDEKKTFENQSIFYKWSC